jgi:hypothetical protein
MPAEAALPARILNQARAQVQIEAHRASATSPPFPYHIRGSLPGRVPVR